MSESLDRCVALFDRTEWPGRLRRLPVPFVVPGRYFWYLDNNIRFVCDDDRETDTAWLDEDEATDLIVAELWRRLQDRCVAVNRRYRCTTTTTKVYTLDNNKGFRCGGTDELTLLLDALEEIDK